MENEGIIDEHNYAFLTGKSTTQPTIIKKKMILEEVAELKKIALLDVTYDSTEKSQYT